MTNHRTLEKIKAFGMTTQMVTEDLHQIGSSFGVDLGHGASATTEALEDAYYPQFDAAVRAEAAVMSKHYEAFYCLEKSIRTLVSSTLETAEKSDQWWSGPRVPPNIKQEVDGRVQREVDAGITRRSTDELDYTTFGELSEIITKNWDVFEPLFSSRKAVNKVMSSLNSLRNPIAHCSPLAEDEVIRLRLAVRDWFRLME
jgi:hypothetical protein